MPQRDSKRPTECTVDNRAPRGNSLGMRRIVLVIDDEPVVARAIHRLLREVLPTAWEVAQETDANIGLSRAVLEEDVEIAIVDLLMPGMKGDALVEQVIRQRPEMRGRIILCTGAVISDALSVRLFDDLGCLRLDKPFLLETLETLIYGLVSHPLPRKPKAPTSD